MNQLLPIAALTLAVLPVQAGPIETKQVSREANWYAHADLESLRDTEAGKILLAAIEDRHDRQLKAVKRLFSLNPFTDLHGITLYGNGEKDKGVILIKGKFDREHLEDLLGASEDYVTSTHHGTTVHSWKDKKKRQHGAFFGDDLAIISDHKAIVAHALDVLQARAPSMDANPDIPAAPAPVLIGFAKLEEIDVRGKQAKMFEKARSLQMRLFEADERIQAELVIDTTSEDDAIRMQKVLDGMVALGQLAHEELGGLDIGMKTSVTGGTRMTADLSVPTRQFLELADEAGKLGQFMD